MQYRPMGRTGDEVSVLGYGCMRFPMKGRRIDEPRTERQLFSAIDRGVNYLDTAFIYTRSEETLGRILSKGYRDKVKIATKLPPFLVYSRKDMEAILETQLKRLRTGHIDYYLIHSLASGEGWARLKELGVREFLEDARRAGKIGHIGFSFHGNIGSFRQIVDDYPWESCLIQYNYLDERFQAGTEGLEYAAARGLGVAVMEPLRGGLLVRKMPAEARKIWDEAAVKRSPAEWALRWVWDHPQVSTVLSGMSEEGEIAENIRVAGEALPHSLSGNELALVGRVKTVMDRLIRVGCSGCSYCMPCPFGVDIPSCFAYYNDKHLFGELLPQLKYLIISSGLFGGRPSFASLCRECGKCEEHCPQHLPIRARLKDVAKDMENIWTRMLMRVLKVFFRFIPRK